MSRFSTRKLTASMIKDKGALAGFVLVALFAFATIFATQLSPVDPYKQTLAEMLLPPAWEEGGSAAHLLGTDAVGRDILSNIIHGTRVSFVVGVGATALGTVIGVVLGLISGFYGGRIGWFFMRLTEIQLAIPQVLIALAVMTVLGRGILLLLLVIGITGFAGYARTARGATLVVMKSEYVEAARALGVHDHLIILRHVLPNILTPIIILVAVQLPRVIMLESTLSFLGVGVPVTTPSLGIMISRGFRVLFSGAWWVTVFPGIVLMLTVLGVNLIGDWLRDVFDPRFDMGAG